jgi:hypothetical protein
MISILLALTLAAAEPATEVAPLAVPSAQAAAPPANETKKERDRRLREEALNKVTCRDMVLTGTNFHSRVCRQQRVWDAEQRTAQRAATRYQQDGMRSLMPGAH